jgi:hypothetical protein
MARGGENTLEKSFHIISISVAFYIRRALFAPTIVISEDTAHDGEGEGSTV